MPGPFDWLKTKWQQSAPQPVNYFTPYSIAKRSIFYGQPTPEADVPLEDRLAKMRTDSAARQADLRALNERLGTASKALTEPTGLPTPEQTWEGAMETAWKPRGPAAWLLKQWQEATGRSAARPVSEAEALERNLRMAKFGLPPTTPAQFQEEAKATQEIGDPIMELAASMGGSYGGAATLGVGALAGQGGRLSRLGQIARGAQVLHRPLSALFALEGARQLGHVIGDEGLTPGQRIGGGLMAGLMTAGGAKGAVTARPMPPPGSAEAIAANLRTRLTVMDELGVQGPRPAKYTKALTVPRPPGQPPPPSGPPEAEVIDLGPVPGTERPAPAARPEGGLPFDRQPPPVVETRWRPTPDEVLRQTTPAETPLIRALLRGEIQPPRAPVPEPVPVAPEPTIFSPVARTVAPGVRQPTLQAVPPTPRGPSAAPPSVEAVRGAGEVAAPVPPPKVAELLHPPESPAGKPAVTAPVLRPLQAPETVKPGVGEYVEVMEPEKIGIDPTTYQHKEADAQGVTGALRGVTRWNPDAPPGMGHRRLDGSIFIADGFQRLNLYLKLKAQGQVLPPFRMIIKDEAKGWTVEKVQRAAALQNLIEPTTNPTDIAKLLRSGPLAPEERALIPPANISGKRLVIGEALSELGDDAYRMVVLNKEIPPEFGASVARRFTDPAQQARAMVELKNRRFVTQTDADAFLAELADTPFVQGDIFGKLPGMEQAGVLSLVDKKVALVTHVGRELRSRASAFANVLRNAPKLTEAGNVLVGEVNQTIADQTRTLIAFFNKFKDQKGTATRRAINDATERMASGEIGQADASERIIAAVRSDIETGGTPPPGPVAGGPAGAGELPGVVAGEHGPAVAAPGRVAPEEVPTILQKLKTEIDKANLPPPEGFGLEAEKLPPPTPRELETQYGQRNMEDVLAGKSVEVLETEPTLNAARESAASAEAISRARGMAERGDRFEMVDAGGHTRPLVGPDAVDVRPGTGETKILRKTDGSYEVLEDNGGNLRALGREAPTPVEELVNRAKVDLTKEQAEVREAVSPLEQRMREVTGKPAPAAPEVVDARQAYLDRARALGFDAEIERGLAGMDRAADQALAAKGPTAAREVWDKGVARLENRAMPLQEGQVAWTELENGGFLARPDSDGVWVRLNEGQTHLSSDLAAAGFKFRRKWGTWVKNVTDSTRAGVTTEAQEILGARPAEAPPAAPVERGRAVVPTPAEMPARAVGGEGPEVGGVGKIDLTKPPTMEKPPPRPDERPIVPEQEVGRRPPLPPEVQEYADAVDAMLKNRDLPEMPNFAEHQIEIARRAAERKRALIKTAQGVEGEGGVVSLLEKGRPAEFTNEELQSGIDFYRNVDDFQLKLRAAPGRLTKNEPFPEPEGGIRPRVEEQHRLAQERAQWIEEGTPDALERYAQSLRDLQDREYAIQVRNHFTEAKAAPPPRTGEGGEFLGSGLGGLQKMYETDPAKFWRLMSRLGGSLVGGTAGATIDENDPVGGFIKGALSGMALTSPRLYRKYTYQQLGKYAKAFVGMGPRETVGGRPALRFMPDAARDISLFTRFRPATLEHQVPELHRAVWEILDEYRQSAASGALSRQPLTVQRIAHKRYLGDAIDTAKEMAEDYTAAGLKNKAAIARNLADALAKKPTKTAIRLKQGMESVGVDVDFNAVERIFGTNVYRVGIGWALDSATANITQPILGLRHYTPLDLLHGYKMARTPEGIAASAHLRITRPIDIDIEGLPALGAEPTTLAGKLKRGVQDPGRLMGVGDNYNRRVAYLAARHYAERVHRLGPAKADDWAQEVVRASQGDVGATGFNPTYRGPILGVLRPFQKFPALFAENMFDTLFQPNKKTAGTFIVTLIGLDLLARKIVGVDLADMLLMGGRVMGIDPRHPLESLERLVTLQTTPAGRAAEDVRRHLTRTATHPVGLPGEVSTIEDLLNADLPALFPGRYPVKVAQTALRFGRYGLGAHMKRTPSGAPEPVTALEDLINLVGFKTTRQTEQTRALADISGQGREEQVAKRYRRNEINRLYLQARDRGDTEEAQRQLQRLDTVASAMAMVRREKLNRYERLLQSASPEVRRALEDTYGKQVRALEVARPPE